MNILRQPFRSIRGKLLIAFSLLIATIFSLVFIFSLARLERVAMEATIVKAEALRDMTAYSVSAGLYFGDTASVKEVLLGAAKAGGVKWIVVRDTAGAVVAAFGDPSSHGLSPGQPGTVSPDRTAYATAAQVVHEEFPIGSVEVGLSLDHLLAQTLRAERLSAVFGLTLLGIGILLVYVISTFVTKPLEAISLTVDQIASGDLSLRAAETTDREIAQFATAFNKMVDALAGAHLALERANADLEARVEERTSELQRAIDGLRHAQEALMQAQKMEAIGQLAGGIAHDFNNILTVISTCSELLMEAPLSDEAREDAVQINEAAARAAALTRQLLAFTRKQVVDLEPVNVDQVLSAMQPMLRRLVQSNIRLSVSLAGQAPTAVMDRSQFEQVILNLVLNASDAMPAGGELDVAMELAVVRPEGPNEQDVPAGRYVRLCVKDTGIGMDAETLRRVFEPFFTTKDIGRGTGLGLATVYAIVDQAGGHVRVQSVPRQGTTFLIYLPLAGIGAASADGAMTGRLAAVSVATTVLLVDDDDAVRHAIKRALEKHRVNVLEAAGGKAALHVAATHAGIIDVLVTDLMMPGTNGRMLARALVAERPTLRVIFMSGYADDAVGRDGMTDASHVFLGKPFKIEKLLETMDEILSMATPPVAA